MGKCISFSFGNWKKKCKANFIYYKQKHLMFCSFITYQEDFQRFGNKIKVPSK